MDRLAPSGAPEPGTVHAILPNDVDDPRKPSGGNVYDRRVCDGLSALGWKVHEHSLPGSWPDPSANDRARLAQKLAKIPDKSLVLIDGLIASSVPDVLAPQAKRLHQVILVHMPLEHAAEERALTSAAAVITTSNWTRQRLLGRYRLPTQQIVVAAPGTDPAPITHMSPDGTRLLCVANVSIHKGHDILREALHGLDVACTCVGALQMDLVASERMHFTGPLDGPQLDKAYASADLLVLPSRGETYGMVVTEALAHGIPVLATEVGGVPEALGRASDGTAPGILVPPNDIAALHNALRTWLHDRGLRARLWHAALDRRTTLKPWTNTAETISTALTRLET